MPEVRGGGATRVLRLRVVVVPALHPSPANAPWVELVGGPGSAATDFARQFVEELTYIRETHDVLLVDQRGTGGSNPLYCAELALHQVSSLPPRFPPSAVDVCRARLAAHATLDHYTTADAAEDLEAVRQALGYETLNLFGSSYGTRVALEYLRRHSAHARSAMLWGVVPPDFQRPLGYPRDGQAAFDSVVADCAREATCRRAFPTIVDDLRRLLASLDTQHVPISLMDPGTKREVATSVTSAGVAQAIWSALTEPDRARQLPWVIHAAVRGNYAPLRALDVAERPPWCRACRRSSFPAEGIRSPRPAGGSRWRRRSATAGISYSPICRMKQTACAGLPVSIPSSRSFWPRPIPQPCGRTASRASSLRLR